jgi:hypothetical protein
MARSLSIEEALQRLEGAVSALEAGLDERDGALAGADGVEGELHRLAADRSRLAQSLDAAEARAARLEKANGEVARGLVGAMETIRDVLARNGA